MSSPVDVVCRDEEVPKVNYVEPTDSENIVSKKNIHKIHDPNDPVRLLSSIVRSRNMIRTNANTKLATIGEQMDMLVAQAKRVVAKCKRDERLHEVACNLEKKPGTTYYLYEKPHAGQRYFSLLSPEEWGPSFTSGYLGAYRLEADHSFTLLDMEDGIDDELSRKYRELAQRIKF